MRSLGVIMHESQRTDASGVFDDGAVAMMVKLCTRFGARFYDSEQGRFVI
jgi:hypothetical protein